MASRTLVSAALAVAALLPSWQINAQSSQTIRTTPTAGRAFSESKQTPVSGMTKTEVTVRAQIQTLPPNAQGSLTLRVVSELNDVPKRSRMLDLGTRLIIEIPLSSTGDAYGESRSCSVSKEGATTMVFTAGLDEKNFVDFVSMKDEREFRFLLNKYICRALAAPFQCNDGHHRKPIEKKLLADMDSWSLGTHAAVVLETRNTSATAQISTVKLTATGSTFDYTQCAVIAPSNGVCCVGGKTTQWHCGGTPAGEGWHQVSGDCFHRETGGTCKD